MRLRDMSAVVVSAVVVSAVVVSAAVAAAAVSAPASNSSVTTRPSRTFRVFTDGIVNLEVDSDGNGKWSLGDLRISRWNNLDREGGTRIGRGSALCTAVGVANSLLSCTGSDSLPGGTVIWHGVQADRPDQARYRWAITGGTGKYRRGGGEKSVEIRSPTTSRDTYELGANGLDPSLSTQDAYEYMGRPPENLSQTLGVPCALWSGGWVPDPDPWWKKYGGKRATWFVQLCFTNQLKKR